MKNNKIVSSLLCCAAILIVSGTGSLRPMIGCVPPSEEDMKRMKNTIGNEKIQQDSKPEENWDEKKYRTLIAKQIRGEALTDEEKRELETMKRKLSVLVGNNLYC